MMTDPTVLIQLAAPDGAWLRFERPLAVLVAHRYDEVTAVLARAAVEARAGQYVAGFLSYEAAPAMDPVFAVREPQETPAAWFAVFERFERVAPDWSVADGYREAIQSRPGMTESKYGEAVTRIRRYLQAGDTYQVNFTFPLRGEFHGDPYALLARLVRAQQQQSTCCAFIETADFAVCSASPELFLERRGNRLVSAPMKGTAPRGLTLEDDEAAGAALASSPKNRSENVMIVDMVRNDMGRIAVPGSVHVPGMFELMRLPTVWQMISRVLCRTTADAGVILRALFPCASITGAPKVRTMQIIRELETAPRGVYTGCIGFMEPDGNFQFNVAIRTAWIDKRRGALQYGIGSGIVWDSDPAGEYHECLLKAAVLNADCPRFELLETLLWEPGEGFFLLDEHLERLAGSARYFGFHVDAGDVRCALETEAAGFPASAQRVRLLVDRGGRTAVAATPLSPEQVTTPQDVCLASQPIDTDSPFIYHKTTNRAIYDRFRAESSGCADVILWNADGFVTESTTANVVIENGGVRITPPVGCGLLAGTYRRQLLAGGKIREGLVKRADLRSVDAVYLINSVRRWIPVRLR